MRGLSRRKIRQREGLFVTEGIRSVEDLLTSALVVRQVFTSPGLQRSERGRLLNETIDAANLEHRHLSESELDSVAETESPQGVVAVAEIPDRSLDAFTARLTTDSVVLVLDAVQDPGNFGTLVRTAEALGAAGVVSLPGTVDAWNPKSVRAAMGATFRLPAISAEWPRLASWLEDRDFMIMAAAAEGLPISTVPRSGRVALIVGNEGAGISEEVRMNANCVVGIPIRGRAESLNVSAAAAILLYELLR